MKMFNESLFYKSLQDFFINNNKETFLQLLAEFYNRTEDVISEQNIQSELIKELRELYTELNDKGLDENVINNKINLFLERNQISQKIESLENDTENIILQLNNINGESNYLKNKNVVMMGDSIMDICGIPENVANLSGANVFNVGFQACTMQYMDTIYEKTKEFSGYAISKSITQNNFTAQESAIVNNPDLNIYSNKLSTLKNIDFAKVDIVTIAYGTNDFGFNGIVGTKESEGNNNVAGAIKEIVKNLQSINSNMEIIFFTPIYRADKFVNNTNVLEDYASVIKETASSLGVKVIDLFTCSGINEFNYDTFLKTDKLHPNTKGAKIEANAILKYIKSGYVGKTNEEFQKSNTMVVDNENLLKHHVNNRGYLINNNKYLTHAKTEHLKYKDMILCDGYFYFEKLDSIRIDFDYIDNADVNARVDVILYDTNNNKVVEKFNTLSKAENETHRHLEVPLTGVDSGRYRLYVGIKAMSIDNFIYIRNISIEKKEYKNKIMYGSASTTITGDNVYYTECRKIYKNYNDWGDTIIPYVTANCTDREILVSVIPYWNHVDMVIEKKDHTPLTNGKTYTCNFIAVLPI